MPVASVKHGNLKPYDAFDATTPRVKPATGLSLDFWALFNS
jgi:hypothetical protein